MKMLYFKLRKSAASRIPIYSHISKLLYTIMSWLYNCSVPYSAKIAEMPVLPHGWHGIHISHGAVIGKNVTIYHHVTIGSNQEIESKGYGYPVIGDNCFIGASAVIIGGVEIGESVKIGANATVCESVPSFSTVVSPKAFVIKKPL